MPSGGLYTPFKAEHGFTPGESRLIRYLIGGADDLPIESVTGWTFEWFLLRSTDDANGLMELRDRALIYKEPDTITTGQTEDDRGQMWGYVQVPIGPDDLPSPGMYAHELWRIDEGNESRLARGPFEILS